jgi:hypothetical protein
MVNTTTGGNNTVVGYRAGRDISSGTVNTCIGWGAGRTGSPFQVTTQSGRVVIGNDNVTNAYVRVAWTVTSDGRDKTDIEDIEYGLDFINKIRPVKYKWNNRSSYKNEDGIIDESIPPFSRKEDKIRLGFIAQEVIQVENEFGNENENLLVADAEQEDSLKITETHMIPVLVKAIQELKAELESVKDELQTLKNNI